METMTQSGTTDLSQVVVRTYEPKAPNDPATDGQIALMQRFELKTPKGMTQGQANKRLNAFFCANPDKYVAWEEEKRERAKARWAADVVEYVALAASRSRRANRVPATENQIRAVMAAAFIRRDVTGEQAMEARQLLDYGVLGPMAHEYLNGLPRREDDVQAQQPN